MSEPGEISKFIKDQLSVWPLAADNFRMLKKAAVKDCKVGYLGVKVQHNPSRIASSTAETDEKSIAARPCFLCEKHRPKEQLHLPFEGRKGRMYNIQINPYPIFPGHLVIARREHLPQTIWHHFPDMLDFTVRYPEYTVFYNGPLSGASAPDHLHFQACPRHLLPLEDVIDAFLDSGAAPVANVQDALLYHFEGYTHGVYALKARTSKSMAKMFYRLLECSPRTDGIDAEPRFNLFAYCKDDEYRAFVVLRTGQRSHHYYSEGRDRFTMSPGAADVAGYFVAPLRDDYDRVDSSVLEEIMSEVTLTARQDSMVMWRLTRSQRTIDVGILTAPEIEFEILSDGAGLQKVSARDGRIDYNGTLYDELYFESVTPSTLFAIPSFRLCNVTIGIGFHWERKFDQKFAGALKFIPDGDNVIAVNRVGLEDYLLSVISSEMKPSAPLEFLKAHAVISRSWLLSNLGVHGIYDVCADDHCQRYQGLTMVAGENVRRAVDETWGQTLRYEGELCDARFSKCCGGRSELFSTCWEDRDYPYLQSVMDPYCDCDDASILSTVLNDYDVQTRDFHDWTEVYTEEELSSLVKERSGEDFGRILSIEPVERGVSGRIKYLRVTGEKCEKVFGKELVIRRLLSVSHLKSSDFTVSRSDGKFILRGRGWGHGVGLCQIGAAVMACKGADYVSILKYYYTGADVE